MHPPRETSSAFDPLPDELAGWFQRAAALIAARLRDTRAGPVFQPAPPQLTETVESTAWPEEPQSAQALLDDIEQLIWPYPMGNNHPRFFGWVNTPAAPIAVVGEMLASAMNPSVAGGGHAATYVEHHVLQWFRQLFSFPPEAAGLLVSGGSMATLTGLTVARHAKCGWDIRQEGLQAAGHAPLVLYMSQQGHSCITKSAELLGLGRKFVRAVECDGDGRMNVEHLHARIKEDRGAGLRPFCVVATAGAVASGAIDPLDEIADLCAREELWLHVDGAIGAVAMLLDEFGPQLAGLQRADSIAFDPHKWLYVPVECGAVLVRDGAMMRDAFSLVPAYLRTQRDPTGGPPWFSEFGFQQSRGFRALKLWMALRYYGRSGYRAMLRHCVAMGELLREKIGAHQDLELCDERAAPPKPRLPIVTFRYRSSGSPSSGAALDQLNEAVMQAIQQRGAAFLTQARLGDRFALRACLLNYRTSPADIDALVDEVRLVGAELAR